MTTEPLDQVDEDLEEADETPEPAEPAAPRMSEEQRLGYWVHDFFMARLAGGMSAADAWSHANALEGKPRNDLCPPAPIHVPRRKAFSPTAALLVTPFQHQQPTRQEATHLPGRPPDKPGLIVGSRHPVSRARPEFSTPLGEAAGAALGSGRGFGGRSAPAAATQAASTPARVLVAPVSGPAQVVGVTAAKAPPQRKEKVMGSRLSNEEQCALDDRKHQKKVDAVIGAIKDALS